MKSFLSDLARKQGAKSIPPIADRFMTNIDAPFMKKVFDIAKRKGKSNIHHHRQADDLGAGLEIAKRRSFGHGRKLRNRPARLKQICSDNAHRLLTRPDLRSAEAIAGAAQEVVPRLRQGRAAVVHSLILAGKIAAGRIDASPDPAQMAGSLGVPAP